MKLKAESEWVRLTP